MVRLGKTTGALTGDKRCRRSWHRWGDNLVRIQKIDAPVGRVRLHREQEREREREDGQMNISVASLCFPLLCKVRISLKEITEIEIEQNKRLTSSIPSTNRAST